jgi:hypothetical protein
VEGARAGARAEAEIAEAFAGRVLDMHVGELNQLFNSMDPAPFRERDLDPRAEEFIVEWARETRSGQRLGLVVRADGAPTTPDDSSMLREAVHEHFRRRARGARIQLRRLFRTGRISLVIALLFALGAMLAGEFITGLIFEHRSTSLIQEGLVIGGWVALWRPMEIFLYDWWPIRAEAKLFDRLSEADVRLAGPSPALRGKTPQS